MAGTTTVTIQTNRRVKKVTWDWLSDGDGDADQAAPAVTGEVMCLATVPDGGDTAPTNAYDITITDADGVDIMQGTAANLLTATTEVNAPTVATAVNGVLTLNVSSAGAANGGLAILWIRTA